MNLVGFLASFQCHAYIYANGKKALFFFLSLFRESKANAQKDSEQHCTKRSSVSFVFVLKYRFRNCSIRNITTDYAVHFIDSSYFLLFIIRCEIVWLYDQYIFTVCMQFSAIICNTKTIRRNKKANNTECTETASLHEYRYPDYK